ncbi:glycosyltransferase family protein [Methylobacterium oxalidis]|uniref:Membrane protein n=1 Tax=Methylobacterium oxalidis TaxID=944322 RepID=A0A512J5J3_9HYPH|nr:glycosyltransferase [Methylobacterium oxalidis]GEP05251.1 membrane protein [Methylobacterium oxalidis]GJE29951.1 hypothetical protein LDDCCGHA_0114 [Methylobacterium oxalidis]GLS64705.1 membrane protein [Methylobacterium oxalidis]
MRTLPEVDDPHTHRRVLIYSHDTFGLGHLRRARAIAHAVVGADPGARVVIASGSPVIDRFAFAEGVSLVHLPPVAKRPDGSYASREPGTDLGRTVADRAATILRTAELFEPHVTIVDKEPAGFHGDMLPALERLSARGCRLVLGIRDVLDAPERLVAEWARKRSAEALARFYDEVWVYGVALIHDPLAALPLGPAIRERVRFTGYLRRGLPDPRAARAEPEIAREPFILVTPGGGEDGVSLIDGVLAAYEADPGLLLPALVAFGPFLDPALRAGFRARIARLPKVAAITFDSEIEHLMHRAAGIVAMGGYNTFCEILSFDKPALLVPRTHPRREQEIRAVAADRLGLARILPGPDAVRADRMAAALRALPDQLPPSRIVVPGLLDGLPNVMSRIFALSEHVRPAPEADCALLRRACP